MSNITTGSVVRVGIDLAKNVFALHGVDERGRVVLSKTVSRVRLAQTVMQLPSCLIGMEACSGAHAWAREFRAAGYTVQLIAPKFVTPYRKSGKNDSNDAEAICEAVGRPNMRFVPVKSVEQQCVIALHRMRQGYVEERTALVNRIRAVLTELGTTVPVGADSVRRQALVLAESLPELVRGGIAQMRAHLTVLDGLIADLDRQLTGMARQSEPATRLMTIRGIGPITALAIVAAVGDAREFKNGRQFAAWLGLTPRQHSSGGKTRLGRITRHGDRYLRMLLVLGARAALNWAAHHDDRLSAWARSVHARRGYGKAVVAIAAKNARIAWALLRSGTRFAAQPLPVSA